MKSIILILICFTTYLFFALPALQYYSVEDEVYFQMTANSLNVRTKPSYTGEQLGVFHPLLYTYILALFFKIFSSTKIIGSCVGIICFLFVLVIIYLLPKQLYAHGKQARAIGFIACLIYCLHPMVIQGSLILEIDNTVLVVLMSLFLLCYLKTLNNPRFDRYFMLGILFSVVLWAKITTPIVLILSILLFLFLNKDSKRIPLELITIFFTGCLVFLISWWVFSQLKGWSFAEVFIHVKRTLMVSKTQGNLKSILYLFLTRLGRVVIWLSPTFLILGFLAIFVRIKQFLKDKRITPADLLIIYCVLIFFGYILIGGPKFGYPKYHYLILPMLSVIIAGLVYDKCTNLNKRQISFYALFGLLALFYYWRIVGDPIYSINYTLKMALYDTALQILPVITDVSLQLLLYLLPVLLLFIFVRFLKDINLRLKVISISLIIILFSSNLALNILQLNKGYNLTYDYGESRKDELILYLQKILRGNEVVLAPLDIVYYVTTNESGILAGTGLLKRPRDIRNLLINKAACVVYGRNSFNVDNYQNIINSHWFQALLHDNFIRTQIGTYSVWRRGK